MNYSKLLFIVIIAGLFLAFWGKASITLDPDFGFRMRTGKMILESGIPQTDPYSYTMPSFPYVEHALLIAVSWGYLFPLIGYWGIALVNTLMVVATGGFIYLKTRVLIGKTPHAIRLLTATVYLTAVGALFTFIGNRAQVTSWLLFAILFYLTFPTTQWKRFRAILPAFFLLWAYTHGSFVAGLAILAVIIVARFFRKKVINRVDLLVFGASALATLATPYGVHLWNESLSTITDSNLRMYIYEWMPPYLSITLALGVYAALSLFFIIRYRLQFELETQAVFIFVLIAALSSTRNIPIFIIFSVPLCITSVYQFSRNIKSIPHSLERLKLLSYALFVVATLVVGIQIRLDMADAGELAENTAFPKDAVLYLRSHPSDGELFSQFYWGGYLIWKLPEKKVFIDGRMASWRNPGVPESESTYAFLDYIALLGGDLSFKEEFDKYDINVVLWSTPQENSPDDKSAIGNFVASVVKKDYSYNLISLLVKNGWQIIYQDEVATIYQKPKSL